MKRDPRIDAYVARQADFARPILDHLRASVHAECPECEETLKWGMPTFMYRGEILASMAAFKRHATFGFWRGSLVLGGKDGQESAMGQFGRLTGIEDLPDREALGALIRKAMALTEQGVKPARARTARARIEMPADFRAALDSVPAAAAAYEGFSASARRDYLEWIVEAKREETRAKRIAQAVEWIAEGRKRNWKYENC